MILVHENNNKPSCQFLESLSISLLISIYTLNLNLIHISLKLSNIFKLICFLVLIGCSLTKREYLEQKVIPHRLVFDQYGIDFKSFHKELLSLKGFTEVEIPDHDAIKRKLTSTRLAYKRIEFIFDYLEPNYAYLYINGGPLPKLHKEVAEIDIIPPNGLQRLDELGFAEDLSECIAEIIANTNDLIDKISFIQKSHLNDTISAQNTFEALRSGIVRVFTLGLTGFDTPGSGNGLAESKVSLKAMGKAFAFYSYNLSSEQTLLYIRILNYYQNGISQLESNNDFDSFDRLSFLKEIVNPLYKDLYSFQKSLDIETRSSNVHAQNYNSENIFEEDFLDRNYYTQFSYNDINKKESIELGRTLFYDPILSKDFDMSCSTCHNPKMGFAYGLAKSLTNRHDKFTKRNSPTLIDAAYSSKYFWDMREHDLEKQVAHVVEDSLEFNIGFKEIEKRLYQSSRYIEMFDSAFGGISKQVINHRAISNAIASYVNTLTSFDSPFDQYVRNESEEYTESAKAGFNLFMGKAACGTCHFAPVFNGSVPPFYTDAESEVPGITEGYNPTNPIKDEDMGRSQNGRISDAHPHFDHSFKTVTVRNIALTAPYMHNGLFESLEDAIDFYNDGGGAGMGLNVDNQTLASDSLNLSESEKSQLIDFLYSLTDTTGLNPGIIDLPKFESEPYWNQRGKPKVID